MAEDAGAETLGKLALGGAVGFALFFLVTGLGLGGRGRGEGETKVPPRLRDERRLTLVMQGPEAVGDPMAFRLRDDDPSTRTYSLEEAIARIRAGGRADVNLRIRGSVLHGPASEALGLFARAGIQVLREETPPSRPVVSGSPRGTYRGLRGAP